MRERGCAVPHKQLCLDSAQQSATRGETREERPMRGIFANRWWIVFATVCGLIVGGGAVNVFAFGVFLKPITADLGVGRATFSSALTLHSLLSALSCPVVGWLVDRWGARRVMIPG